MDVNFVVKNFFPNQLIQSLETFGHGHINSTYKVVFENSSEFILQRINKQVFTKPSEIIQNHLIIQDSITSTNLEIPQLAGDVQGNFLYTDSEGQAWRMMNFIKDSYSVEYITDKNQAYEAGKGFGWFLKECSTLNPSGFNEAIKDFHSISFRYYQLNEAIKQNKNNRISAIEAVVKFYKDREQELIQVEELIQRDEIPRRVVHNDTKVNNLLFRNEKAIAVIDLDTVGPGSVLFDYGDAIRTIANPVSEDEKNLDKVNFNINAFKAFNKGYLEQTYDILNPKEKDILHMAPFYMSAIMGIRFLSDYLNGDVYYKISYPEHNLDRSLVQKTFIEEMELKKEDIQNTIKTF